MSSRLPYVDLSHLYRTNRHGVATNTMPSGMTNDVSSLLRPSPSLAMGPTETSDRLLQRELLNVEDPRTALLLGMPSLGAYSDELVRQAQASSALRRYHDLKMLEAASAASNPNVAGGGVLRNTSFDFRGAALRLAPTTSPSLGPLSSSPVTMSANTISLHAPTVNAFAREDSLLGGFAQLEESRGRTYSAFDRAGECLGGGRAGTLPPSSMKMHMQITEKPSKPVLVKQDVREDEEAFFKSAGSKERFPVKLHRMIYETEKEGRSDVVSFLPHGKAFAIHDAEAFVQDIMPRYFANCQLTSFQKQLNLYGFHKITVGKDKGKLRYFHASFLKGRPSLSDKIQRRRTSANANKRKQLS